MKHMKLKIRNVGANDFGTYRCVAKNSLGETDGNIKLDEMPAPTTAILSEMAMLNRSFDGKRRNKNKLDSNSLPDYGVEEWRDGAGNSGDNNQSPMRNPPDAFHNSAGALAQHNPLAIIIQAIKTQSCGIFKRLTNLIQTLKTARANAATPTTTTTIKATTKVKGSQAIAGTRTATDDKTLLKSDTAFCPIGPRKGVSTAAEAATAASSSKLTPIKYVKGIQRDFLPYWGTMVRLLAGLCRRWEMIKSALPCGESSSPLPPILQQQYHEHQEPHYAQHKDAMRKNLIMENELKMYHDKETSSETYVDDEEGTQDEGATAESPCQDFAIIYRKPQFLRCDKKLLVTMLKTMPDGREETQNLTFIDKVNGIDTKRLKDAEDAQASEENNCIKLIMAVVVVNLIFHLNSQEKQKRNQNITYYPRAKDMKSKPNKDLQGQREFIRPLNTWRCILPSATLLSKLLNLYSKCKLATVATTAATRIILVLWSRTQTLLSFCTRLLWSSLIATNLKATTLNSLSTG
uniref:Immunoglobulin I-set domain-containing protein n=1 Tax=Stomoxys calcitrans TaxID=35570 RepID=A0A1I8QEP1_STOCA